MSVPKQLSGCIGLFLASLIAIGVASWAAPSASVQAGACKRELEHANKSIAQWAETMENMVNESKLPAHVREAVHKEANTVLDMIEDFGEHLATLSPAQLAKELVAIRRRSNKMALDVYLNTFDMRWPQNSLHVGVMVERVQQACLDGRTIQTLETASSPLTALATGSF